MLKQAKILSVSLVASIAVLTLIAGTAMAQDSDQSGCGCCKKMHQTSGSTNS